MGPETAGTQILLDLVRADVNLNEAVRAHVAEILAQHPEASDTVLGSLVMSALEGWTQRAKGRLPEYLLPLGGWGQQRTAPEAHTQIGRVHCSVLTDLLNQVGDLYQVDSSTVGARLRQREVAPW